MNDLSVNDYLTNLETDKEELVNNLNERGVDASTDETFTSLTKKVKTIGEGSMPYATEDIAGVIKVGKNLKMDNDGKLNASLDEYPTYEVTLVTDFINDTGSSGRGLSGNDRNAIWDMYHWAQEISPVSDYCVTYTFKDQPCQGGAKTFKKYITYFYTRGSLPTEYLLAVCFGYYANGAIINGHAKSMGSMTVASLYFRFDPNVNIISVSVTHDSTGEYLVNTYALTKDNRTEYTPTGDYNPATKLYVDNKVNEVGIQFIEMPEASAEYVGKVFQYIGETTATYIKGHFYTCISDRAEEPSYQWTEISLGGASGSARSWEFTSQSEEDLAVLNDWFKNSYDPNFLFYQGQRVVSYIKYEDSIKLAFEGIMSSVTSYVQRPLKMLYTCITLIFSEDKTSITEIQIADSLWADLITSEDTQTFMQNVAGYDNTKNQVLKNAKGTVMFDNDDGSGSSIPTLTEDTYIRNLTGTIYKVQDDVKLYLGAEGYTTYYLMPTENITNSYLLILKDESTELFRFVLWAGRVQGRFYTSDGTDNRGGIYSAGNIFYSQVSNRMGIDWVYQFTFNTRLGSNVTDNLTSTSATAALSARQGKVLNERITNEIGNINTVLATLVDIEEGE